MISNRRNIHLMFWVSIAARALGITFFLLFCHTISSHAYEFVAQGTTKYQIFSLNGAISVQQEDIFSIQVKECRWFIRNTPTRFIKRGRDQRLMAYWVASSDLTNFYQLTSLNGVISSGNGRRAGPPFTARIGPGGVPFGLSDPKLILLWYAFASTCYFDSRQDQYINPPTVLIGEEKYANDFRVAALWNLLDAPPFLPQTILFEDACKPDPKTHASTMFKRLDFTNCIYNVERVATNAGLVLPKLVTIRYFAKNPTNPKVPLPTGILTIIVTNFEDNVLLESFKPQIPEDALLSDMRTISQKMPIGVAYRNVREWPRVEESLKRATRTSSRVQRPLPVGSSAKHVVVLRVVLVTFVILPLLGFGIWKWAKKK